MKINNIIKVLIKVICVALMVFFSNSSNAYAFTDENNVTVNVTSDKESYSEGENIALNVYVENKGQNDISDVNIKCIAPNKFALSNGEVSIGKIEKSKQSNSIISLIAHSDNKEEDTNIAGGGTNNPSTSDEISPIAFIILIASAGIVVIICRKNKKALSYMVIAVMFGTLFYGTNASATETLKTIALDKTILVKDEEIKISFKVTYKIEVNEESSQKPHEESTGITDGKEDLPFDSTTSKSKEKIVEYVPIEGGENYRTTVVESTQELKDTLQKYHNNEEDAKEYNSDIINNYNDEYFKNNILILYPYLAYDGNILKVSNITIKDNVLSLNTICEKYYSEDGSYPKLALQYLLLGEVPKSETNDQTTVTVNILYQLSSKNKEKIIDYDAFRNEKILYNTTVVKNLKELQDTLKDYILINDRFDEWDYRRYEEILAQEYNDKYFENNNLVLYPFEEYGGEGHKPLDVTKDNNNIILNMTNETTHGDFAVTDQIEGKLLIAEVPKSDFNDQSIVLVNIKRIDSYDPCMYKFVSSKYYSHMDDDLSGKATIIKSVDELQQYNKLCNNKVSSDYSDEFFNEKSLIALPIIEGSSSISHEIGQLVLYSESYNKGKKLQIDVSSISSDIIGTCDMCEDFIIIEVDKNIVEDINEIEVNNKE